MNIEQNKLYVQLSSEIAYYKQSFYSNSQWLNELSKPNGCCYYEVQDLIEARKLCKAFIDNFDLGASNWRGGLVVDQNQRFVAMISYNGRIWDNQNWRQAKEIEV